MHRRGDVISPALQREQEEAAKLYEDFVESFGDKEEDGSKSFVKGEVIQPGTSHSSGRLTPARFSCSDLSAIVLQAS